MNHAYEKIAGLAQAVSAGPVIGYAGKGEHSELDHQLDRLNNAIDATEHLAAALRERLSPVMRLMPETGVAGAKEPPEEVLSPCGDAVRSQAKRIARTNTLLDAILNALAV